MPILRGSAKRTRGSWKRPPVSGRRLDAERVVMELQKRQASEPEQLAKDDPSRAFLRLWVLMRPLCGADPSSSPVLSWVDEWMLSDIMRGWLVRSGWTERFALPAPGLLVFLLGADSRIADNKQWPELLADAAAQRFLEVNLFNGARWFSREGIETMTACVSAIGSCEGWKKLNAKRIIRAAEASEYRWDDFLKSLAAAPKKPAKRAKR